MKETIYKALDYYIAMCERKSMEANTIDEMNHWDQEQEAAEKAKQQYFKEQEKKGVNTEWASKFMKSGRP